MNEIKNNYLHIKIRKIKIERGMTREAGDRQRWIGSILNVSLLKHFQNNNHKE